MRKFEFYERKKLFESGMIDDRCEYLDTYWRKGGADEELGMFGSWKNLFCSGSLRMLWGHRCRGEAIVSLSNFLRERGKALTTHS